MKKRFVVPVLREEASLATMTRVLVSGEDVDGFNPI